MSQTLLCEIALTFIPGIGPVSAKSLLAHCGSAENVFRESFFMLSRVPGIGPVMAKSVSGFSDFERAEKELLFIEKHRIRPLFFTHPDYPYRLKQIADGPVMLFVRGGMDLNAERILGIVGTRKPSAHGKEICRQLIAGLRSSECRIISGMAYGIDIIAHREALRNEMLTAAVVAHGLDRMYPPGHIHTAREMIAREGAIVTEFATGTKPDAPNFPRRNRIVAGLCDAILVIESAEQGGSLITADLAFQYDRDVMAVPGRPADHGSTGCNKLIKSNKACLVEDASDVLKIMNWDQETRPVNNQQSLPLDLTKDEKFVLETLENAIHSIDKLTAMVQMPPGKLSHVLLELELRDLIETLPGKKYKRK